MRKASLTILLVTMLAVQATAELRLTTDETGLGVVHGIAAVMEAETVLTHQNMALRLIDGDRTWFVTENLHEHDGLLAFHAGSMFATEVHVSSAEGNGTAQWAHLAGADPTPTISFGSFSSPLPAEAGDGYGHRASSNPPVAVPWVVRGDQGVWSSGWVHLDDTNQHVVTVNTGDEYKAYLYHGMLEFSGSVGGGGLLEERPRTDAIDPLPDCGDDVRFDPDTVLTGNPVRVLAGPLDGAGRVTYRLIQDIDAVRQEVVMEWISDALAGAASFRAPREGDYRLIVEGNGLECQVAFIAEAGSTEAAPVEWTIGRNGSDIVFEAEVPSGGHYEFPVILYRLAVDYEGFLASGGDPSFIDGKQTGLVWAGKLHSHGGPVSFRVPDAPYGVYTVIMDVGAQGADPVVGSKDGWVQSINVVRDEQVADESVQEAPAPLGVLALIVVALLARRR